MLIFSTIQCWINTGIFYFLISVLFTLCRLGPYVLTESVKFNTFYCVAGRNPPSTVSIKEFSLVDVGVCDAIVSISIHISDTLYLIVLCCFHVTWEIQFQTYLHSSSDFFNFFLYYQNKMALIYQCHTNQHRSMGRNHLTIGSEYDSGNILISPVTAYK